MARLHEGTFKLLCSKPETRQRAITLFNLASAGTAQGSGHELGNHSNALPAICAYLASQELRNNDVTEEMARKNSCTAPRAWATCLKTVSAVLAQADAANKYSVEHDSKESGYSYSLIASAIEPRLRGVPWLLQMMTDIEKMFMDLDSRWTSSDRTLRCAVFAWTCSVLNITIDPPHMLKRFDITSKTFDAIMRSLDTVCDVKIPDMRSTAASMTSKRKKATTAQDQTSNLLLSAPSSPTKAGSSSKAAPQPQTPSTRRSLKRKLSTLESTAEPDVIHVSGDDNNPPSATSPSKRSSTMTPSHRSSTNSPTKRSLKATPSQRSLTATPSKRQSTATPSRRQKATPAAQLEMALQQAMQQQQGSQSGTSGLSRTPSAADIVTPRRARFVQMQPTISEIDEGVPTILEEEEASIPASPTRRQTRSAAASSVSKDQTSPSAHAHLALDDGRANASAPGPRRRFRPILEDLRQWSTIDPRVEREIILARAQRDKTSTEGNPAFEAQRARWAQWVAAGGA